MEKVFTIPKEEVKGIVRSVLMQKVMIALLALLVCVFMEIKAIHDFHTSGIKSAFTNFESTIIFNCLMVVLFTTLLIIARRGFTRLYESFKITIDDKGIERYGVHILNINRLSQNDNIYFAWEDVTSYKESSKWLIVYSGTRKISIPKQIEQYEKLKAVIVDKAIH